MESPLETAHARVCELIAHFAAHEAHYLSPGYQEAEARKDFIAPLLIALGWDVNHEREKNPFEQEVKVERGVAVANAQKRADYAFYLQPNYRDVRFFVEAKKPSVVLATDRDAHWQTIRYGSCAQTPLALLTDFQELHVLDCRLPADIDTALDRVHRKYHYRELQDPARFAELYWLFSREALESGAHDRYVAALKKPRGAAKQTGGAQRTFDARFLDELEEHREHLAQSFKRQHRDLDGDALTELVQRVLDRLVFLRFLEDKLIETRDCLADFGRAGRAWDDFTAASRRLDGIYNGVVFKKHPRLDAPGFLPDDRAFAEVCRRLSHIHSPYLFSIIPIHVLGSIYERFLGKIIVATEQRARVEEKPEVRKAGGVYYTPEYIVRYIVAQTVGKLIAGKSPAQIAPLRFADIACGSGSFLLGVFDCLLRHHTAWFNEPANARRAKAAGCLATESGAWRLSLQQRRAILVNNVFGVDLDPQAVEVAQLSLYLKLLEDETTASARGYQLEFHETLLPSLAKNIVPGNSLIGTDILLQGDFGFTPREERKLGALDFERAFPEVFRTPEESSRVREDGSHVEVDFPSQRESVRYGEAEEKPAKKAAPVRGGFDAIVGNPPYVRIQVMQENSPLSLAYLKSHYVSATRGNCDIYVAFVERALSLLRAGGSLGYILPHKFFNAQYGAPLRGHLSAGQHLRHIVHFGEHQVFNGATTYTCLLFLENARNPACDFLRVTDLAAWQDTGEGVRGSIPAEHITAGEWNFSVGKNAALVARLARLELKLAAVADIFVGLQTSADDVYVLETISESARAVRLKSAALDAVVTLESALLYPLVSGTDVKAYAPLGNRQRILFPYVVNDERAALLDWKILGARYPRVADYLTANKPRLAAREGGKFKGPEWYRFGRSQNLGIQQRRKLCVPRLVSPLHATLDNEGTHFLDNVDVGGVTIQPAFVERLSLEALLALLNSTLLRWYFPFVSAPFRGGWMSANRQFLGQLPIALPDRTLHDQLVALANQMLAAKKQETASQSEADRDYFARKCADLAAKIDALVYQLYGLSPAEIDLVEGRA